MSMTVVVTGACGWIGRAVCACLQSKGITVIGADLTESDGPWDDFHCLDITTTLDFFLSGIDTVIHCAGYAHRPNETPEEQKMFYAVNRDGTRNMLEWSARNGVERFLYVGSIASYDWKSANGVAVAEEHPMQLETHYARSKQEGEQLVTESALDWRVVRLATVFGEGDPANFSRMVHAIKRRLFFVPGRGIARKSVVPVDIAAELICRFALEKSVPHRLINLALPKAPSLAEICTAFHEVCGLSKVPRLPMPLVKALAVGGDLATAVLGRFPFSSRTLEKLVVSTEVSTERMQECFPNQDFGSFRDELEKCKEYYISL
ncbi:MAG: NAD(P)-dependent oxidoreductase [Kiritimatiellaceae bacterium]|nr:NAD(P)-dependent oxidoreductase [Kiritimatiellaceae bacterium]